jgi:hypothetical protein
LPQKEHIQTPEGLSKERLIKDLVKLKQRIPDKKGIVHRLKHDMIFQRRRDFQLSIKY